MTITDFEKQLRLNYSSKGTIESYLKQIKPFLKFCKNIVNQDTIDDYLIERRNSVSTSSYNLFLNALKKYLQFSNMKYILPVQKRIKSKEKPYFTLEELQSNIIKYTPILFYNYDEIEVILLFMFYTGIRPKEILQFKVNNIDFNKKMFTVKDGKGEKDRIIPFLNNKLISKLEKFINKKEDMLFNLTKGKLNGIFRKIQENCGFNYLISPYTMRRSFAKHCVKIGIDIYSIQKMMGHNDISTTLIYAKPDDKMLIEICEKVRNI